MRLALRLNSGFSAHAALSRLLTVVVVDDLEILDGGLSDSAVEVEHVGLGVVVPHGRLVVEFDDALRALVLPSCQQRLVLLKGRKARRCERGGTAAHVSEAELRTFRGRMDTLSWSMFIPGMITLILRGPLNPKTLVSWMGENRREDLGWWRQAANQTHLLTSATFNKQAFSQVVFTSAFQRSALTHIANGCELLTQVVGFEAAGGFHRVEAAVIHRELGAHEVGPASRTQRSQSAADVTNPARQMMECYIIILLRSSARTLITSG